MALRGSVMCWAVCIILAIVGMPEDITRSKYPLHPSTPPHVKRARSELTTALPRPHIGWLAIRSNRRYSSAGGLVHVGLTRCGPSATFVRERRLPPGV